MSNLTRMAGQLMSGGGAPNALLRGRLLRAFAGACMLAAVAPPPAAGETNAPDDPPALRKPVVIELFTSQGCSSCPPADKLMGELAKEPGVFVLTLPVDYWDYVGWKDTLALPAHTQRQRGYAKARGDGHVYTPQVVVDGMMHVVGSKPRAIRRKALECDGREGALSVPISAEPAGDGLRIEIGAATAATTPASAVVWLVRVASHRTVTIGRGENSGRTIAYTNVARGFVRLGEWRGQPMTLEATRAQMTAPDADGWMVLVQAGTSARPGVILAAAKSSNL